MARIDLTKFKKPTKNFLVEKKENEVNEVSSSPKKDTKKIKEITKTENIYKNPVQVYLSDEQITQLTNKRGFVTASTFLRNALVEAGIIK